MNAYESGRRHVDLPEYLICQSALSLPSNYNPHYVNIPHKRQYFNRAPNFIKCTPNWMCFCLFSQAKTHLRTLFLQNSSEWLLLNVSYLYRKAKREAVFHSSSVLELKFCNCIKIEKQPPEVYGGRGLT